uniref:Uncharacterized protein n=1 Tax=Manihot esculenta TaxID=3983 RepID=A0A2C9W817_MANES
MANVRAKLTCSILRNPSPPPLAFVASVIWENFSSLHCLQNSGLLCLCCFLGL